MADKTQHKRLERPGMQCFLGPGRKIMFPYDAGNKVKYQEIPFGWFWINNGEMKRPTLVRKAKAWEIAQAVENVRARFQRRWWHKITGLFRKTGGVRKED